jgi:hypothetical protein
VHRRALEAKVSEVRELNRERALAGILRNSLVTRPVEFKVSQTLFSMNFNPDSSSVRINFLVTDRLDKCKVEQMNRFTSQTAILYPIYPTHHVHTGTVSPDSYWRGLR